MNYNIKHSYLIFLFDVSTFTDIVTVSVIVLFISIDHFIVHLILLSLLLSFLLLFLSLCEIVIIIRYIIKVISMEKYQTYLHIFHTFDVLFKTITDVIGALLHYHTT